MPKEIERKFLISEHGLSMLNGYKQIKSINAEQIYLAVGLEEIRVRQSDQNAYPFVLTIKSGIGMEREELELPITQESYNQIRLRFGCSIQKCRRVVEYEGLRVEIDVYQNPELNGLVVAEIEFDSVEQARSLKLPVWAAKDVTDDPNYKNSAMWTRLCRS